MISFKQYLREMDNQNDIPTEHAIKSPLPHADYPYHLFVPKKASESDSLITMVNTAQRNAKTMDIPIDKLVTDVDAIDKRMSGKSSGPIYVEKIEDTFHVRDGNHRAAAALLRGDTHVKAIVADMTHIANRHSNQRK
jgi:hypothetical protein